mgnify:CR=1 FL=1
MDEAHKAVDRADQNLMHLDHVVTALYDLGLASVEAETEVSAKTVYHFAEHLVAIHQAIRNEVKQAHQLMRQRGEDA